MKQALYVAYEHGWPVCVGTAQEVADFCGVEKSTVQWGSTPKARKRGCKKFFRIEDEEEQ